MIDLNASLYKKYRVLDGLKVNSAENVYYSPAYMKDYVHTASESIDQWYCLYSLSNKLLMVFQNAIILSCCMFYLFWWRVSFFHYFFSVFICCIYIANSVIYSCIWRTRSERYFALLRADTFEFAANGERRLRSAVWPRFWYLCDFSWLIVFNFSYWVTTEEREYREKKLE